MVLQFDVLVATLPCDDVGDEAQLRRIEELQVGGVCKILNQFCTVIRMLLLFDFFFLLGSQAENDAVGQELQWQLEAAGHS